jgi:hypothetical protein
MVLLASNAEDLMVERTRPQTTTESDPEAIAVMVHGTFASAPEDEGERWWQSGSRFASSFQALLPASVRVAGRGEVFHWSGANSDRARSKAATKLLRHLHKLEDQGHDYHLVGHSHGGSVIWNAMQMSMLINRPLQGLRSWTTIGTPFMHHRGRGALNIKNLVGLIIGLVLLMPAMWVPKRLITTLYNVAVDNRNGMVLELDHEIGYANLVRTPVLAFVECFGIAVDRQPDGVHVGSFDPGGSHSLAQYVFGSPEGLFLLILMTALSYIFIHFSLLCISPVIESYRMRLEQRLRRRAFEVYGSRWLGILSPDDEAINGLRASLDISVSFVSKMMPREVVFLSDTFALLSRPYYWLLAPLYNRFVHPAVDSQVRNIVIRAAQGNDRPTATLIDVTPAPVAETGSLPPLFLPALLNVKLLSFANRHAHELVPKLRCLIAQTSFTSGLEAFGGQLSGKELVHTAYFEHEEILKLIAGNMTWDASATPDPARLHSMSPWLRKWFIAFKAGMSQCPIEKVDVGKNAPIPQPESQRRKAG